MTEKHDPPGESGDSDEGFVFFEEEDEQSGRGDDLARALADAEKAVTAVEARHRRHPEAAPSARPGEKGDARVVELLRQLEEERARTAAAEQEAGEMREALLRKVADFENLKRRTEREKTDFFKFALAEVFRDLAGVLDNFHRAMAHSTTPGSDPGSDEFRVGIEMIQKQLEEVLRRYGLAEIAAKGLPFDPNVHEAILREVTEAVAPGTVIEVLQTGYHLNERLLRPARVKVAAAPAPSGPDE